MRSAGDAVVTSDPASVAAFEGIQTRSLLCVPLVKDRRFVALLALHHPNANHGSYTNKKLVVDKRLDDIVVTPGFKASYLVFRGAAGCQ